MITDSQEYLRIIVEKSPVAMLVSAGVEQRVSLVNRKFTELFGYTIDDIPDVEHWWTLAYPVEEYRKKIRSGWAALVEKTVGGGGNIEPMRATVACKNGSRRFIEFHFSSIGATNLVTFIDLTERELKEDTLRTRLRLSEFSIGHSEGELLRAALDEAERLTGSSIGFFHFVDDDQLNLSLQVWSTNTLKNMCSAEDIGSHYPISEAGVWVDCFHERKPVVHNDYESLPHKKGMPPGHAPVVRELVVPVILGDKVRAILGVGNKETPYDDGDIEIVSSFASMVWSVVTSKRAEAALKNSERFLETVIETAPT